MQATESRIREGLEKAILHNQKRKHTNLTHFLETPTTY